MYYLIGILELQVLQKMQIIIFHMTGVLSTESNIVVINAGNAVHVICQNKHNKAQTHNFYFVNIYYNI